VTKDRTMVAEGQPTVDCDNLKLSRWQESFADFFQWDPLSIGAHVCSLQLYKHLRFIFEITKDVPEEQGVEITQNKNYDSKMKDKRFRHINDTLKIW